MTKHEYHIALVLLALITAGVLGHQALNGDKHQTNSDCTLALYFSGPFGCDNTPRVESITAPVFTEKIEDYFSPGETDRLYDINMNVVRYVHDRKPDDLQTANEFSVPGTSQNDSEIDDTFEEDNYRDRNQQPFLLSDSHSDFLQSIFGDLP